MKEYPAFIIDRSRRSEASRFSDDFIVCTDREVGFIARLYKVQKSQRDEVKAKIVSSKSIPPIYYARMYDDFMVVLKVERYLYEPVAHVGRVVPLFKKAMKAYLFGELAAVKGNGAPYDNQIAALDDVIRMAEAQKSRLCDMSGEAGARAFAESLKAARESVALLQKIVKKG